MSKRPSLDEYLTSRKDYVGDNGVIYKGVVSEKAYDPEKRKARFVMSSEASDRMSDVVKQSGIDLANFIKNPVALAYHKHDAPIGMWKNVEVITSGRPSRTEGDLILHEEGVSDRTDEIARIMAVGGLKAVSIGFIPKEVDYIRDENGVWKGGFSIPSSELLEASIVTIPAQPAALMKAVEGNAPLLAETLEYILDTYCEKTTGGLYVRKEYEEAYDAVKRNKVSRMTPKQLEHKVCETLVLDIDTREAEEKVDGLLSKLRKGLDEIFGTVKRKSDETEETETVVNIINNTNTPIALQKKEDGSGYVFGELDDYHTFRFNRQGDTVASINGEWPEKAIASPKWLAKEFGWEPPVDGEKPHLEIKTSDQIAVYRSVKTSDDSEIAYFELVEVKEIEPEPVAPVLVKGSRAQAEAKIAKLKASLLASAATS